jgi:transcriptional regulator with XRE-family HTH domain
MSQSKVSRIENGRLLPSVVDVDRILRALGVDQATSAELLALARVANAEYQDIRRQSGAAFIIASGNWPLSKQTPGKCATSCRPSLPASSRHPSTSLRLACADCG